MLKASHKIDFDAVPSLHLFDSLIAPILNYNSEVWSQLSKQNLDAINNNDYKLEKLFFDTPEEKLHLQFCRNILGVANKTSIAATLGELKCYPLMIKCFNQMINTGITLEQKLIIILLFIKHYLFCKKGKLKGNTTGCHQ